MALAQHSKKRRIGIVGLGATGGALGRTLLMGGQRVLGFDIDDNARTRFMESGGLLTRTSEELVRATAIVFTALPDTDTFIDVIETRLLPHAVTGQVFVDVGTTAPRKVRQMAKRLGRKGASLLDAPLSGALLAGESLPGTIYCGGEMDALERVRPQLEQLSHRKHVTYCGGSGSGQVARDVERLAAGLIRAALLEALSYGVNNHLRPEALEEVMEAGGQEWQEVLATTCTAIGAGEGEQVDVHWARYRSFLQEARDRGGALPLSKALHFFLRNAPRGITSENTEAPSLWHELTRQAPTEKQTPDKPTTPD